MIAGRGTPDQAPARLFAYRHPELFAALIERLVHASVEYLLRQVAAGAEALQIFDSWAGVLPPAEFERWCVAPIAAIVAKVRAKAPNDADHRLPSRRGDPARQIRCDARNRGRSASTPRSSPGRGRGAARKDRPSGQSRSACAGRGRLRLDQEIDRVLKGFEGRAHIFNLGHGILPETPIAHVERLVARVRGQ